MSPPFAAGYGWRAWRTERSWPALFGFVAAALELATLVVLMAVGLCSACR